MRRAIFMVSSELISLLKINHMQIHGALFALYKSSCERSSPTFCVFGLVWCFCHMLVSAACSFFNSYSVCVHVFVTLIPIPWWC